MRFDMRITWWNVNREGFVMRCPFFEEVLVAYCRAYPIKKMVPSDRLHANCVCTQEGFEGCPLFREVVARVHAANAIGNTTPGNATNEVEIPGP
jgi:hypothetical protein